MKERGNLLLQFVDRFFGIPLVFLLALRPKKKLPAKIETIGILKSAGIGDLIFMSAVIQDIRKAYPFARILLFTGLANRAVGELIEGVDVMALPMTKPWKALRKIREHTVDVWIDGDPWPRISAIFSCLSRSKFCLGFKTQKQYRHFGYDAIAMHSPKDHEIDSLRRLMIPLGIPTSSLPQLNVPRQRKKKVVVLHQFPGGSRAYLKLWDKWQELTDYLIAKDYLVVTTGGKGDVSTINGVENRAGKDSLLETAKLLSSASCVITVDTGILHLSAAVGTFTIALHGPTFPHRCGGLGENVVALTPKIDYTPCIYLGFENKCRHNRCMRAITLQQVIDAFEQKEEYESNRTGRGQRDQTMACLS